MRCTASCTHTHVHVPVHVHVHVHVHPLQAPRTRAATGLPVCDAAANLAGFEAQDGDHLQVAPPRLRHGGRGDDRTPRARGRRGAATLSVSTIWRLVECDDGEGEADAGREDAQSATVYAESKPPSAARDGASVRTEARVPGTVTRDV